jgi:hypothetical protein
MRKAWLSLAAVPAFVTATVLFGLADGANAMSEDGSCSYSESSGTCESTDCPKTETDPHQCQVHSQPTKHCDCVPKELN